MYLNDFLSSQGEGRPRRGRLGLLAGWTVTVTGNRGQVVVWLSRP